MAGRDPVIAAIGERFDLRPTETLKLTRGSLLNCLRLRGKLLLESDLPFVPQRGATVELKDPRLRRFWFPIPGRFGIGVTAYTREEAEGLARTAARDLRWDFTPGPVAEDVDLRTLDQGHVIPNMRAPNFHGVWFPSI